MLFFFSQFYSDLISILNPNLNCTGPTSPFPAQFQDPPKLLSPRLRKPVSFDLDSDHVIRCVDQKLRTTFPEASSNEEEEEGTTKQQQQHKEFNFGTDEKCLTIDDDEEQRFFFDQEQ
ncbi:unnamed protein product [Microthlaspi erraticum]|uniref:Uncharacterized protein n=1 Tax=Microthlaspi erraticum TaxID=1685480 RepID=A0A6D2KY10_9BRAS|nr:unnamed protein product [Microthlaspi erraticum]